MPKLEVVNANNVIEFNPQKANFKLKNTGGPKGEPGAQGPQGPKGDTGAQGPAGASASVTVGSTTTLSPGAAATVTNSGDTRNAILNFGIPTGARGPKGDTGSKGDTGPMGPKGAKGDTGAAATVQVGNTNTGAPGTNASVENVGNEHNAILNFTIPRGDKGETGSQGPQGIQGPAGQNGTDGFSPIATVTQEGLDAEISITDKDGTTTATVPGFGVQVVESLPATGSSNVIYLERDSNSASGNPISIADAVEAPLKSLEIQGNTSQQTYTGKNLMKYPYRYTTVTRNGITFTDNGDGTVTANGTATADALFWLTKESWAYTTDNIVIPAGTYTISKTGQSYAAMFVTVYGKTQGQIGTFIASTSDGTFTTTEEASLTVRLKISVGATASGLVVRPQIEAGSTATSFEPYVGGIPAPNPDYPQAVQTVTGENVIQICGKNLWGAEEHGSINENTGEDVWNANRWRTVGYIPVESNTAYTLSSNASADIYYIFCFYDSGKNFISSAAVVGGSPTRTTPADCEFMRCVVCDTASIKTTERQLELGSTATAYEPYQGQSYEVNLGKNLFNPAIAAHPSGMPNNLGETLRVDTNTTYTFNVGNDRNFAQVQLFDNTGTRTRALGNGASDHTLTFTTTSSEVSGLFCFYPGQAGIDPTTYDYTGVQLEKGSQATPYAAYFEPIELCKIGDYQDSIYKSGGKWYVRKEVGETNLANYNYTVASTVLRRTTAIPNMKYVSANTEVGSAIAEKYIIHEGRGMSAADLAGYMAVDVTMFAVNVGTSDTSVKPTGMLYYALATPTDTEITNEALVAQLEAILAGGTQAGVNTIALTPSAGATGTLEVEYYDSYDSYLWVNNRWEKFAHLG